MSATLSKTIKEKGMDDIFTEVPCPDNLGLSKPGQLRLFHLRILDGEFYHADLEKWLYRNLSRYVFSRARLEQFKKDDDLETAVAQAMQTMKHNGAIDTKGIGNELGEMLIYAFLEGKLSAPKLMSRVKLFTDFSRYKSVCEGIHLLPKGASHLPFNQVVFGTSSIIGDIRDAVDSVFEEIVHIKENKTSEIQMVEKTSLEISASDEEIEFLKSIIVPEHKKKDYNTAFGIFLGYTIGVREESHPEMDYEELVVAKMAEDIRHHSKYIADKIKEKHLTSHSFYVYILPFMDAETNKIEIMEHVVEGAVSL